jgi:two-component system sensor histidine kinase UhpB
VAEDIAARARSITQTTLALYNSGRALVRRLRPEVLDMLGLQGAIEEMVRQMDASHPDCRFACRVEGDFAGIEPELAISIYRIVQEALSNVVKHARATQASVLLARRDGAVTVEVRDDGIGYAATAGDGMGIAGMRERVHAANGSFTIDSDGAGTRIAIRLPLP